jgi:uncharacterized coiled-coil DUF342 family protein
MDPSDQTNEILLGIRQDLRRMAEAQAQTNRRLDRSNAHLQTLQESHDATNERLDQMHRWQTEANLRLATEVVSLVKDVHELRDVFVEDRQLRQQVANHEHRIQALEREH